MMKIRWCLNAFRKIELGFAAFEPKSGCIISSGGCFCCFKSTKPDSSRLIWVSDFGCPLPPWSLSYTSIVSSSYDYVVMCFVHETVGSRRWWR
ncbi:hypothetical protein CISIN_1g034540mg [Citrus sinensis]|uniref:Uncharacterized protein n=1 Tax=Citrus sinensis TaxID=2711 RepID=A0A067D6Y0_CITSI|nr:hypothetical protein CISIN_1g034540mg [Citrus sinensis]KDO38584.1 hypothetical protein CISIN_1g034540mg [Citrus sinensis]